MSSGALADDPAPYRPSDPVTTPGRSWKPPAAPPVVPRPAAPSVSSTLLGAFLWVALWRPPRRPGLPGGRPGGLCVDAPAPYARQATHFSTRPAPQRLQRASWDSLGLSPAVPAATGSVLAAPDAPRPARRYGTPPATCRTSAPPAGPGAALGGLCGSILCRSPARPGPTPDRCPAPPPLSKGRVEQQHNNLYRTFGGTP